MSKVLRAFSPWVVVAVCAIGSAGCGGHSTSPTAPSSSTPPSSSASPAPAPPPAPAAQSATITGTVALGSGAASGVSVGVAGTALAATSDAGGNFAIASVPPSDVVLTFSAPGVSASAPVGSVSVNDALHVEVTINGASATVTAQQKTAPDNSVSADGTLSDLDKPSQAFRLGSTVVSGGSASITRAGAAASFADLVNGDHVYVRGTRNGNGIRASQVDAQPAPAPPPANPEPTPAPDLTYNGPVAGLSGTCPSLTMTVDGKAVRTSAATAFTNRNCGELRNGDTVYAIGPKQSDGSVLAAKIYYVQPPDQTVTLTGAASSVAGTCPAMTLKVQGTSVKTTSATTFDGSKGCSGLANGDSLTVAGTKQSDGVVVATKLTNATAPPVEDTTYNGPIAGLAGTCPSLTMTVDGKAVKTNAATVFNNRTCAELKNGDIVYAIGPKQSDGSVLASKIYYSNVTPDVTVTGTASGVSGTCPAIAMSVSGTAVKATTSTTFDGKKGCTALAAGDSVTVVGTKQSDGTLLAAKVTNNTAPPAGLTLAGTVSSFSGSTGCPAVTLTVLSKTVKTSSATTFDGTKGCTGLANGDSVTVAGTEQSDGSVLASKITNATNPPLYGAIAALTGTCPAVSMTVAGTPVKTSASTTFTKGACGDLKNGGSVYAVGVKQSDGTLLASQIYFPKG